VGPLPPAGSSGRSWAFKTKASGVQQVKLKDVGGGVFKVVVKAKGWFSAGAANDSATNTLLTVSFGPRCFDHAATKKSD